MIKLSQPIKGELTYDGVLSQKFGECAEPTCTLYKSMGLLGHNGIDFKGEKGKTPVYASHNGRVVYAQKFNSITGNGIKILDENGGFVTLYCHLDSMLVSTGESVSQGQEIGKVGNSGSDYYYMAPHLHFGLYECDAQGITINTNNGYKGGIDPMPFLIAEEIMEYWILPNKDGEYKEQYLYYQPLNIALNVGDEIELAKLQLNGLQGQPIKKDNLPDNCLVYAGTEQNRFRDLLGL